jgi:hypothetical protein
LAQRIREGTPPWTSFTELGYALAFMRAARGYQVCVEELLTADAVANPPMAGYLPRVTFDYANALGARCDPICSARWLLFPIPHKSQTFTPLCN